MDNFYVYIEIAVVNIHFLSHDMVYKKRVYHTIATETISNTNFYPKKSFTGEE